MQSSSADREDWTIVLRPHRGGLDLRLRELWDYRDLVVLLVRRDFVATYKQTVLGPLWFLIQPLMTTLMFVLVFGNIARLSTDGQPMVLFYMLGTVLWSYFAACFVQTSSTFVANAGLFGKVYFPRLAVPVAIITSHLMTLAIQFSLFGAIAVYMSVTGAPISPTRWIVLTPLLIAMTGLLALGLGLLMSSMTTRYRDLTHAVTFGTPLLMYITPIVYPLSAVPPAFAIVVLANPLTPIIEAIRFAVLGSGTVSAAHLLYSLVVVGVTLVAGIARFNRTERTFMDTI